MLGKKVSTPCRNRIDENWEHTEVVNKHFQTSKFILFPPFSRPESKLNYCAVFFYQKTYVVIPRKSLNKIYT